MRDPEPGNISGEKVQRHVFKHEINWGYVAVAVALLYIGSKLLDGDGSNTSIDSEEDSESVLG